MFIYVFKLMSRFYVSFLTLFILFERFYVYAVQCPC